MSEIQGAALITGQTLLGPKEADAVKGLNSNASGFQGLNPATNELLSGIFPENGVQEVEQAVAAATEAFATYSQLSDLQRAEFLTTIADELEVERIAIVMRAVAESALPEVRINGELSRTTGQLMLFANLLKEGSWVGATLDRPDPERQPLPKPDLRMMQMPLGPVAVFGASNFPLAFSVAGGDTASALAAGCPVVVKGHPAHPGTSELVAKAISRAAEKCHISSGVFSLLQGTSIELGSALVQSAGIKAVGFTGSLKGGRVLFDLASGRAEPIPFYGELGSTNPVFLMADVLQQNAESLAEGFLGSLNMGCGQFCTNPGLLVACKGDGLERFLAKVADGVQLQAATTMLTPGIAQAYLQGRNHLAEQEGVQFLGTGAEANQDGGCNQAQAAVFTVSAEQFMANPLLEEEVFGPSALLVICEDEAQMLQLTGGFQGHLTSTIHCTEQDQQQVQAISRAISQKVGRVLFNGWPTGVEVAHAMTHGGPYPASTDSRSTSVGAGAIDRWVRPVSWQNAPETVLPAALQSDNPLGIWRKVDGQLTQQGL